MLVSATKLTCQKHLFSLPEEVTYLKNAYMAPIMKSVELAAKDALRVMQTPYLLKADDFFTPVESVKKEFARLVNIADTSRTVIIPSVSYGMAIVAKNINLSSGENIVLPAEQFPSNVYVWRNLAAKNNATITTVDAPESPENRGKVWNQRILESINSKTKVVALGNVHWADGTWFDLLAVRRRCNEVGALLIIDGTQSVGALPFDVQMIQPDALICAAYKWLMGPYSIGIAYLGEYFDNGHPIEESWFNRHNSDDFANLVNYEDLYQPKAMRYQVGESSNFLLIPMFLAALKQVNQWGPHLIQDYCQSITIQSIERLQQIGCKVENTDFRGHHLFGVRLPERASVNELKLQLEKEKVYVSQRGNAIRVAPHVYSTKADMELFVKCVSKVL